MDKAQWEIEQLKKKEENLTQEIKEVNGRITTEIREVNMNVSKEFKEVSFKNEQEFKELNRRIVNLESFQQTTIDRLKLVFQKIDTLRADDVWLKRTIFVTIFTALTGAAFSMLILYFQK